MEGGQEGKDGRWPEVKGWTVARSGRIEGGHEWKDEA